MFVAAFLTCTELLGIIAAICILLGFFLKKPKLYEVFLFYSLIVAVLMLLGAAANLVIGIMALATHGNPGAERTDAARGLNAALNRRGDDAETKETGAWLAIAAAVSLVLGSVLTFYLGYVVWQVQKRACSLFVKREISSLAKGRRRMLKEQICAAHGAQNLPYIDAEAPPAY